MRTRTFTVTTPSANGGIACTIANNTTETRTCTKDCSVNCIGSWGNWEDICNDYKGNKTRTFTITTPAANGGIACPRPTTETVIYHCNIDTILASDKNSYIINKEKKMYGFGDNQYYQIRSDYTSIELKPIQISYDNIKQISTYSIYGRISSTLFLKNDGTVWCIGNNEYGQLGIANNDNQTTLQQVKGLNGNGYITGIKQIAIGIFHSLFLTNDGTVFGCGRNIEGQLGIGNNNDINTLQQVIDATNIKQISTGSAHSLFLKYDGTVFSCGRNIEGQLGIGNFDNQHTLQQVK